MRAPAGQDSDTAEICMIYVELERERGRKRESSTVLATTLLNYLL